MKVSQLIKQLEQYEPDDDLIVAYWDRETIEDYDYLKISKEDWSYVVEKYEDGEWFWQGAASDQFLDLVEDVLRERDKAS